MRELVQQTPRLIGEYPSTQSVQRQLASTMFGVENVVTLWTRWRSWRDGGCYPAMPTTSVLRITGASSFSATLA